MKKYNVTVNGVTYEVLVEEADAAAPAAPAAPAAAPKAAAKPAAPAKPAPSGAQGAIKVTAPMPGTILKMGLKVGDTVKANDLVCILEAMKMENEIFAKEGGVVKSIDAPQGSSVNTGDVIITLG
ncbi:MAG: acetyl-CoA carboxylase biotin carboxyl carrier protein subunit [Clostridia bacterium]|nr:acetyl-CoA carboxylase biotin carboxyl carrier protein subunit [Clostridia bacterium]